MYVTWFSAKFDDVIAPWDYFLNLYFRRYNGFFYSYNVADDQHSYDSSDCVLLIPFFLFFILFQINLGWKSNENFQAAAKNHNNISNFNQVNVEIEWATHLAWSSSKYHSLYNLRQQLLCFILKSQKDL